MGGYSGSKIFRILGVVEWVECQNAKNTKNPIDKGNMDTV